MSGNALSRLSDIFEIAPIKEGTENSKQIYCEFELPEKNKSEIENLLRIVTTASKYIQTFAIKMFYKDDSPPLELLRLRGESLQTSSGASKRSNNGDSSWFHEFKKAVSFYASNNQFKEIAEEIISVERPSGDKIIVNLQVQKEIIEKEIIAQIGGDSSRQNISVWSDEHRLRNWIEDTEVSNVVEEFFDAGSIPVFALLQRTEKELSSSEIIQFIHVTNLDSVSSRDWKAAYTEYKRCFEEIECLFVNKPPLPAKLFDCIHHRGFFQPIFLYAVFGAIADQVEISSNNMLVSIESEKRDIRESIDLLEEIPAENLSALLEFYTTFIERGTRESYRTLWHRAIVEHCSSPMEIIEHADEVEHYYQSLEQNAIEGNFTELSGAVQDAQVFIGDVTNTLSDSTVNATTEIQKVVVALFTVIAANLFLLVRQASLIDAATFTTAFSAGLLLLYFPTAQERVNELSSLIEEGKLDADLYSDLVRNVGADELVDLDRFKDRQDSYIELADGRVDWAEKRLLQAFVLFIMAWCFTAAYALLNSSQLSTYSMIVVSTSIVSLWIGTKQTSRGYQPTADILGNQVGMGLLPLSIIAITLIGIEIV